MMKPIKAVKAMDMMDLTGLRRTRISRRHPRARLWLFAFCPVVSVFIVTTILYLFPTPSQLGPAWSPDLEVKSEWLDKDFPEVGDENEIVILRWTKYFGAHLHRSPLQYSKGTKCSFATESPWLSTTCRITYDRRYLSRSDAVVFHAWDLVNEDKDLKEVMPPYHLQGQVWIFQNHQPPTYKEEELAYLSLSNHFNWTMTYRTDSDVFEPYGLVVPLGSEEDSGYNASYLRQISDKKLRPLAGIVSDCETPTKREDYVTRLQEYIPIDMFGKCGKNICQLAYPDLCYQHIAEEYKFIMSFETSFCVDYVSEIFFNALSNNIVPIVFGAASYSRIAPRHSYIDAGDFTGPKELAEYLIHLDTNIDEYLEYFEWKALYKVARREEAWCGLCQRVHDAKELDASTSSFYENVQSWWNSQNASGGKQVPVCKNETMPLPMEES